MFKCRWIPSSGRHVLELNVRARTKNGAVAILRQKLGYLPTSVRVTRIA